MRLPIAYSKIKKQNLVLINNATHQRETLSERPIRLPLRDRLQTLLRAGPNAKKKEKKKKEKKKNYRENFSVPPFRPQKT